MIKSDLAQLAFEHFGLVLPCTQADLKSAFRTAAKKLHSDIGGTDKDFVEMKLVYDKLCKEPEIISLNEAKEKYTEEGFLLSELGLGLGNVNGRDCENCSRKGYITIHRTVEIKCDLCNGFRYIHQCRACLKGVYTNPVGRKVPCNRCNAKGFAPAPPTRISSWGLPIPPYGADICFQCYGCGTMHQKTAKVTHHRCGDCNGTGEIKIYNPVIMKSGLYSQKQRKKMNGQNK